MIAFLIFEGCRMIVLGIDPGFSVSGWAIVCQQGSRQQLLAYGFLPMSSKFSLYERVGIFYEFFSEKIKIYQVTHLSIETPFLGKNPQTFLKLGYLRGVLYLMANQSKLQLSEYAPKEVKKAITGFAGAQKDQVARVVYMLFPGVVPAKVYDVTDAIAIGLCGLWQRPF